MSGLVLKNGILIDGTGRDPIEEVVILIRNSKIIKIGKIGDIDLAGKDIREIDISGKTVMPGMIEAHVHLSISYRTGEYWDIGAKSLEWSTLLAVMNAKKYIAAGFTSVRDVGCFGNIACAMRDAVEMEMLEGPRIKAAGRVIGPTGGMVDWWPPWIDNKLHIGKIVNGTAEVVRAVREQVRDGVDLVKFEATGGCDSRFAGSDKLTLSYKELKAGALEAHKHGKMVAVHAENTEGIKNAIRAGADTIEHGFFLDEEGAKLMKEKNVILVPTIGYSILGCIREEGAEAPRAYQALRKSLEIAREAGVKIAVGADAGSTGYPHGKSAYELELMVRNGFTEMEAIVSATKISAQAIGVSNKTGTIEEGKLADLIVIDGNPLNDIKILQEKDQISYVIKNGKIMGGVRP